MGMAWHDPQVQDARAALDALVRAFSREFRQFAFGTQQTWGGVSIAAVRRERGAPGLTAVITADPQEMRDVLRQDMTAASVPDGGG